MNKTQITKAMTANETIIAPRKEIINIVNRYLECIREELQDGQKVVIKDLGTFTPVKTKARKGRNPKTGEVIDIPEKYTVKFKPSSNLMKTMNKGDQA